MGGAVFEQPVAAAFADDFSYEFYLRLLAQQSREFTLLALRDFAGPDAVMGKRMYLRHDVDICLEAAVHMAELEAEAGFASTYMVIPTSQLYDIRSERGATCLRRIGALGHEVAIHFDVATSGLPGDSRQADLLACIDRQCELISDITGEPVASISFHRPLAVFLFGPDRLGARVNAYSKTLMAHYRSDSAGRWRDGDPLHFPTPEAQVAQLLTHPIWWSDRHQAPADRLEAHFRLQAAALNFDQASRYDRLLAETVPGISRSGRI